MTHSTDIIFQLKKANLCGRGGAAFPTWKKWELVIQQQNTPKYVICNVSEGEPGVHKDEFLLEHHMDRCIEGVILAIETLQAEKGIVYLRRDLYKKFGKKLLEKKGGAPIEIFKEQGGYLSGEETTLLSVIEGKRIEPRIKPPYPPVEGLYGKPTLINNLETLYHVATIIRNEYKHTRFYTISGDVPHQGVYEFSEDVTAEWLLRETDNFPKEDFFAQLGGGASGVIMRSDELQIPVSGSAALIVHIKKNTDPYVLLTTWIDFFMAQNCDKCVPCREGVYRIREMIENKKIDKKTLDDLYFVLEKTAFCPLGKSVVVPVKTLFEKVIHEKQPE